MKDYSGVTEYLKNCGKSELILTYQKAAELSGQEDLPKAYYVGERRIKQFRNKISFKTNVGLGKAISEAGYCVVNTDETIKDYYLKLIKTKLITY